MPERDAGWDFYLRTLSTSARDSNTANDPASDPSLLQSVKKLHELCKVENSEDLVARVYPQINKIFQRAVASLSQSQTSNGLLLLEILQFYLDFGEVVLHDADPSLRTFFRSCLSREFADPVVAEAMLEFLIINKKRILTSFPNLMPQFFPLLLKLMAWNGERSEKQILKAFPGLMSPGSFIPLFPSLLDLPILVVALEKVEKNSGPLIGSSIASIQKNTAPKMLLALMDEAYTGSTIEDGGGDSESEDSSAIDVADPLFLEILKDENDGIAERPWSSSVMTTILQTAVNSAYSDRLKAVLRLTPRLLDVYFSIALRDVNDSLICALVPLLMSRFATIFPDKIFSYEVHKRLLANFGRERERYYHHNDERNGDWDHGRDREIRDQDYGRGSGRDHIREQNYDHGIEKDGYRSRGSDWNRHGDRSRDRERSRDRDRSRDHDRVRDRRVEHVQDYGDQARESMLDDDWNRDDDRAENQQENNRVHGGDVDRDHNLDVGADRKMDRVSDHDKSFDEPKREPSRRNIDLNVTNENSPSDSTDDHNEEAEDELEQSMQELDKLKKEVSKLEERVEERRLNVTELQKHSKKLEDAVITAKKQSLYRQMQLTKLHECFLKVQDSTERLKTSEKEFQALVDSVMFESDGDGSLGQLTNGSLDGK